MNISVRYEAQVRRAAGAASASLDIGDGATVIEIVQQLAQTADEPLRRVLLDDAGAVRSSVMVFLDDAYVPLSSGRRLDGAATVTITSPISGG
jgi:molybdopterin converting factor small subunit